MLGPSRVRWLQEPPRNRLRLARASNGSHRGTYADHWTAVVELISAGQARGRIISDVHLATLSREHGLTLCTHDRDFLRFPGLRVFFHSTLKLKTPGTYANRPVKICGTACAAWFGGSRTAMALKFSTFQMVSRQRRTDAVGKRTRLKAIEVQRTGSSTKRRPQTE